MRASGLVALAAAGAAAVVGTVGAAAGSGPSGQAVSSTASAVRAASSSGASAAQPVVQPKPPNSADVAFAQMMIPHHQQAVRMSGLLLAKQGVHDRVVAIAEYIARDQSREAADMGAWLEAWSEPATARHEGHGERAATSTGGASAAASMPGMLTPAQLRRLEAAKAPAATQLFLRQMIEHHLGALQMAQEVVVEGQNVYTRKIAKHILAEQTSENDAMRTLIEEL
ncbi:DUF305 domain-containing protein [Motilibacter deserti]|uniref:DUF305 domain-containing protein n=1 Tax=Motilibacter deserti TaxID=2714956 RepID=A0ABX0GNP1_9ACTN|nr:DUF305 domain-containing protein [Motilibacter deserti]NHC12447.1 DUF305 domain-containing protein [Motilibacter deserti]